MLKLNKSYIVDENNKPIAVQLPIDEFNKLEEIIEDYGLAKLMEETEHEESLSVNEAKNLYTSLKKDVEG